MKMERIDPGACDTGANETCVSDTAGYSKKPAKNQRRIIPPMPGASTGIRLADWRAGLVRDGLFQAVELVDAAMLGPVHVLGEDGGPRICIGFRHAVTYVWMERRPWGSRWSNANLTFIDRDHINSAVRYALKLARAIRKAAEAEQARLKLVSAAYLAEKFGGAA